MYGVTIGRDERKMTSLEDYIGIVGACKVGKVNKEDGGQKRRIHNDDGREANEEVKEANGANGANEEANEVNESEKVIDWLEEQAG